MAIETSIIIRTRNEEKWLETVLKKLFSQTYKNFEVVIIDSESTDSTLKIAEEYPVKIFTIPYEKFSYPYALNYGIQKSSATRYIVVISGHSIPISETWLEDGLDNFKKYKNVIGVYGPLKPLPNTSFWDRFFMNGRRFLRRLWTNKRRQVILKPGMGVLGFTNAIIRKDLWGKYNFNESYGVGGEDGEWSRYWFKRGYIVIKDEKFAVYHSHNLGLLGWYKQWQYWRSSKNPQPFHKLSFRKDKIHSG